MLDWYDIAAAAGWLASRHVVSALGAGALVLAIGWGLAPSIRNSSNPARLGAMLCVLLVAARYYAWRIGSLVAATKAGSADIWVIAVFGIELLALGEVLLSMLLLSRVASRSAEADDAERILRDSALLPTVDVFIPTYNEGLEVLEKTIVGALALDWPHDRLRVWVLDDGRRDWLREYCRKRGAGYLTRPDNSHAKAGNINAALRVTDGEFIAVFDADFVPRQNFLMRTIGLFADPKVGCVQTPHHFYNSDPVQANMLMNGIFPDDQRMFFDVIMPSRDAWDAAFCCGSCGVLRRRAIEQIGGGIPTDSVTEDILTTLAMKRVGYITRYLNEKLAFGLAAESVAAFFVQRERWGRGGIQLLFLRNGPLGPGLRFIDRLLFFPASWLVQYLVRVVGFALPIACLWTGWSPLPNATGVDVLDYQAPFLLSLFLMMRWLAPDHHIPLLTNAAQCFASFRMAPSMVASLIKPFGVPFRVTPKGRAAASLGLDRATFLTSSAFAALTAGGIIYSYWGLGGSGGLFPVVAFWSFCNLVTLGVVMLICFEVPRRRQEERFGATEAVSLSWGAGQCVSEAVAMDYSLSGTRLRMPGLAAPEKGKAVEVVIPDVGCVSGMVVGNEEGWLRVQFDWAGSDECRDRMIVKLFASGKHEAGLRTVPVRDILGVAWDRFFGSTWLEAGARR